MATRTIDRERYPYRMKDLCEATGLDRQTIHFYISKGLVPEGKKTGRNMAYYSEQHLDRLRLVRQLQHERFLPLKAIRALLDGETDAFTKEQQGLLRDLKVRLAPVVGAPSQPVEGIDVGPLLAVHQTRLDELETLAEMGLCTLERRDGTTKIAPADTWVIETWGALRAAGLSEELGFQASDLKVHEAAISQLFGHETELLLSRLGHLPAEQIATIIARALPAIHTLFVRYHLAKARMLLAAVPELQSN